ncbi:apolipoprotein L1 [Xenopus laevis]|uniref:Uncharacterized protein n=2 Tax=Xenopus laevis TaxID=8355 RepID=A0A974CT47_XENLA|nr:apolipoprotein L1 [Xenopus laevis]OCT78882.1 hypothetical protein XELAEV_18029973mg [Xenopus laevis]OCT78883.1 hypothetical protein XELAEV_18029973mg [Xenopus laevis]
MKPKKSTFPLSKKNKESDLVLDELPLLSKEDQKKVKKADEKITKNFFNIQKRMKKFKKHMKICIDLMDHIANCIDKVHKDTTIANISGSTAGIAGGITTIVGLALIPVTLGASLIVTAVGIGVAVAGGLTGVGSSIVDFVYMRKQCNKAKAIIEEFMEDLKHIKDSLSNIDIQLETLKSVLGENTAEFSRFTDFLLKTNVESLKNEWSLDLNSENKISGLNYFKKFAHLFNLDTLVALAPCLIQSEVQAVSRITQVASRGAQIASRGAQVGAIASGAFVALGLVIDIVFLIKGSKNLHEGAKTEQAALIRSIARALEADSIAFEGTNVQERAKSEQESKTEGTTGTT